MVVVGLARMMGWPITHLLAAAAAAALSWHAQSLRYDARISDMQSQHASAAVAAAQEAQEISRKLQKAKDDAIAKAQERAAQNAAAAVTARRAADSLREQLSTAQQRLADATHSACIDYATAAGDVLAQCAAEVTELGAKADGHANDAATCKAAWPVMPVKASVVP